jgi:MFS family permease
VFGVAAIIGPLLGAFLVQHVSWSFVFWINLPIGAVTFVMFGLFLREEREPRPHKIDYLGSALMMLGAGGPMLALVEIGNGAGAATVAALAGGGVLAFIALIRHERGAEEPILPLRLWRDRVIAIGCLGGFTGGAVMMSLNAFLPTYVQGAMGRSPAAAGLALGAASVSWTFASVAAGRLMIRTSYRLAAAVGGLCLVSGCAMLVVLDPAGGLVWPVAGSLLVGIGMGFCNTVFLVSTQASVAWGERGVATAAVMFMRIAGSSVGAALFGAILNFGIEARVPGGAQLVNRLLEPTARQSLAADTLARLVEAIAGSVHTLYLAAALVAVLSLGLALSLPTRLSPTRLTRT